MLKINNFFIILSVVLISSFSNAKTLKIIDGDTIHIGKMKYRLYGIDAPETKQQCKRNNNKYLCGVEATIFLQSLIKDVENINCVNKNIDRYKRIVAVCYHLNEDLNKLMVRNGWAIAYRKYSKDYVDDENYAKENKLGIWEGQFIEPYKWRKKNR
jgi:endonuclease YncB( thermonuclease family)